MTRRGGGGGLGYYLIEAIYLYSYVLPHRVGFLCRFGLKTGIWSEIGYSFRGLRDRMNVFIASIPNE